MQRVAPVVAIMCLTALSPALAREQLLRLDPATSRVLFVLDATLHEVHGTFRVKEGVVRFDPATGAIAGRIVVDTESGETGNAKRDRKMHEQVLESARFPEIVFEPATVTGLAVPLGRGPLELSGTIELKGERHEVRVPLRITVDGAQLRAEGRFEVPYVAWGLPDPSVFVLRVGKQVAVSLELTGRLAPPGGSAPAGADE